MTSYFLPLSAYAIDAPHLMFDWCYFTWEIEGNYGVWDSDFRYEVYSLGIQRLAAAAVTINIDNDFGPASNHSNQNVALVPFIENMTTLVKKEIDDNFKKLAAKIGAFRSESVLCFLAIRPLPSNTSQYAHSYNLSLGHSKMYHLSNVCKRRDNKLQDWLYIIDEDETLSQGLSTVVKNLEYVILIILALFFPLIVLKILPWGDDLSNNYSQKPVNIIQEMAKLILNKNLRTPNMRFGEENAADGEVRFTVEKDHDLKVVVIVRKKKVGKLDLGEVEWQWKSPSKDERGKSINGISNSGKTDEFHENQVEEWPTFCHDFIALDTTVPAIFGLKSALVGRIKNTSMPMMTNILTFLRRFMLMMIFSCNAFVLMVVLDHTVSKRAVQRLNEFREKHQVEIMDLGYWNYFNVFNRIKPLRGNHIRWDMLYFFTAFYWCFSVFLYALPGVTPLCIKSAYPSKFFGFFKVIDCPRQHLYGLRLVHASLMHRLSVIFKTSFWSRFGAEVFRRDPINNQLSAKTIVQGVLSLFCVISVFPTFAMYPALYSWDCKYWPKAGFLTIATAPSCIILIVLVVLNLKIYLRFIIFSLTSLIFHYHVTIGVFSIFAGGVGFLASIVSQVKNCYLRDKMIIHEIIKEIHEAKLAQCESKRNRLLEHNSRNRNDKVYVPELSWWWTQENWPCIPLQLYDKIVLRLRPIGSQRARILLKFVIMGLFLGFIFTVMDTLGMNDVDSVMDAMKMVITAVAIIVPSIIAKLQSSQAKTLLLMQKKAIVRDEVERFLENNKTFYNYDSFEDPSDGGKLKSGNQS